MKKDLSKLFWNSDVFWFLFSCIFVFLQRFSFSPSLLTNWDETVYFTIAWDILHGGVPYQTTWEHKGPLLYFLFIPVIAFFGSNIIAIRIYSTIWILVSMFFVMKLTKELIPKGPYFIAPLIYGCFFSERFGGHASNAEIFMFTLLIISLYFFVRSLIYQDTRIKNLFLSGLFSALAFFIKQIAVFIILAILIFLCLNLILKKKDLFSFFKEIVVFCSGGIVLGALIVIYFALNNALSDFLYAFFTFNRIYIASVSIKEALILFGKFFYTALRTDIITFLTVVSFCLIISNLKFIKDFKREFVFVCGLTIAVLVGIFSTKNMYPHYFLQMALPSALWISFGLASLKVDFPKPNKITLLVFSFILAITFCYSGLKFKRFLIESKNLPEYLSASYVKANTNPEDTIFVVNGYPIAYFLAERKPATKYLFWVYHQGRWGEILKIKEKTREEFIKKPPKYMLYSEKFNHYIVTDKACNISDLSWMLEFIKKYYYLEKVIGDFKIYRFNKS